MMGFRAKHRRANWIPEREAKSVARQAVDDARKAQCAIVRAKREAEIELEALNRA